MSSRSPSRSLLFALVALLWAVGTPTRASIISWQMVDNTSVITGHGVVQNSNSSGSPSGFALSNSFAAATLLNGADCALIAVSVTCNAFQVALVVDSNYGNTGPTSTQRNGIGGLVMNFDPGLNIAGLTLAHITPAGVTSVAPNGPSNIQIAANAVSLPNAQSTTDLSTFDIGIRWNLATTTPTLYGNSTTNPTMYRSVLMFTHNSSTITPLSFNFFQQVAAPQFVAAMTNLRCTGNTNGCNTPNVRYDMASVPEPASLALLGSGLAALWAVRRRRRAA